MISKRWQAGPVAFVVAVLVAGACSSGHHGRPSQASSASASGRATTTRPAKAADLVLTVAGGASLPAAVSRVVALPDGDRIVLLGGEPAAGGSRATVLRLDPASGAAVSLGSLSQATHDAAGAVIGGAFVVFGGGEAHTIDAVQSIAPGQPARVISHLPQPRSDVVSATVDNHTYLLGGYDGTRATADVLDTTDGLHFGVVTRLPTPVRYAAVAVTGHRIWLFGGEAAGGDTTDVQVVDLDTRTAKIAGHLPQPLAHAAALAVSGRVVVAGGRLAGQPTDHTLLFDPDKVAFTAGPALPKPVLDAAPVVLGDTGYLIGGESPKPVASIVTVRMALRP